MTLPKPFLEEIQTLSRLVIEDEPADWLQYCADYFHRKLSTERKSLLASSPSSPQKQQQQQQPQPSWAASVTGDPSAPLQPSSSSSSHQKPALSPSLSPSTHHHLQSPIPPSMASSFASPFGANSNPFGGGPSDATSNSGLGMHRVIEEEESDILTSPTTPRFGTMSGVGATLATTAASAALSSSTGSGAATGFRAPFGGDDAMSDSMPPSVRAPPNTESYPEKYNFGRRTSVSAESLKPSADTNDNWTPPYHEKTPEQLERLKRAIASNFLFSHLDDEQADQVLGALVEKPIPAKDIKVISQGDAGDFFYVVEKGAFDIYIHPSGALQPGPDGMGSRVSHIEAGESFGELALMYNAPRAATVVSAVAHCTLWALDRVTFRRILMESTFARRRMYELFLEEVPLLASLTAYERSRIADALRTHKHAPGEVIIREGEPGSSFFLLEAGEAIAYKGSEQNTVKIYNKGDFFGELALLNDAPRAASVVARTDVKVASLGKSAFQRLLGPVEGYLRGTQYENIRNGGGVEGLDSLGGY